VLVRDFSCAGIARPARDRADPVLRQVWKRDRLRQRGLSGQDGFYQAGCPTAGRFTDNGDGTVTDNRTGLMWQKKTALGTYMWQEALKYCENLSLAGHDDWRLPNVRELQSIVDYGRRNPSIDPVFGAVSSFYWSSSTYVHYPPYAWIVSFHYGYVGGHDKTFGHYVRAVRRGS